MNLIEKIREKQMEKILSLESVKKGWVLREKFLTTKMDDFTKKKVISLSDYLGECFRITAPASTPTIPRATAVSRSATCVCICKCPTRFYGIIRRGSISYGCVCHLDCTLTF